MLFGHHIFLVLEKKKKNRTAFALGHMPIWTSTAILKQILFLCFEKERINQSLLLPKETVNPTIY